ncbi:MAG: TRAP transporter small permease [Burkholderiales bacterium]|nr:TRAP transporter small permease [Burkholderiales bacterium]
MSHLAAGAVRVLVVAMVLVMLGVLAAQILLRYAFNHALTWSEELSLALLTWAVLLSAALGVKEGIHVRMALLVRRLPAAARLRAEQAIHLATAAVGAFLAWSGWRYFADTRGTTSAAIGYPNELLHIAALVCGVLIALFALEAALEGRIPPDEGQD